MFPVHLPPVRTNGRGVMEGIWRGYGWRVMEGYGYWRVVGGLLYGYWRVMEGIAFIIRS